MAITVNSAGPTSGVIDAQPSLTFSHTVAAGTDKVLFVGISFYRGGGAISVSSVTFGAQGLTHVNTASNTTENDYASIWRLINPNETTANIVITLDNNSDIVGGAITLDGVDQTTPVSASNPATGNSTQQSVGVTSATGELVLAAFHHHFPELPPHNLGGSQTGRWDLNTGGGNDTNGALSTKAGAAGTVTQTQDITNTRNWAAVAASVTPSGGTGTFTRTIGTVIPITKRAPDNAEKGIYGTNMLVNSVTTNSATYFTGAVTPGNNKLNLLWVFSGGTSLPTQVCSNVATWTQVTNRRIGTTHAISVWRCCSGTHANGTIKIGYPNSKTGNGYILVDFDRTSAVPSDNGSSAIVAFASNVGTGVTSATVSLSAFATHQTWDGVAAGFLTMVNANIDAETDYTRVGTSGFNTPATGMMAEWKSVGGDIDPSCSWSGSSPAAGGIALQLQSEVRIHGRALATVRAFISALVGQVKSTGSIVRNIAFSIVQTSRVSRIRELVRFATVPRGQSSLVKRIASHKRSVLDGLSFSSRVARFRLLPRTIGLVRSGISRVSQRAIYRRTLTAVRPAVDSVKRIANYIRKVAYGTPGGSSVRRLRRLLRTIAFSVSQSSRVSRALAFLRTLQVIRTATSSVSRLRRLLRAISLVRNQTSQVRRLGSYLRTISRPGVIGAVVRGINFKVRTVATALAHASRVDRLQRLLRRISLIRPQSSSVSRLARYLRTIRTGLSILARVSQSRIVGVVQRSVLVIRSQTSSVKRSARYLRVAIELLRTTPTVSRVARYLRTVRTQLSKTFSVSRLLGRLRTVALSRGAASAVRRSNWYVRSSLRSLGVIALLVGRRASYLRSVATRLRLRLTLVQFLNLGELTILRIETFLREKVRFNAGANFLAQFRGLIAEKIKTNTTLNAKTSFKTGAVEKTKYKV